VSAVVTLLAVIAAGAIVLTFAFLRKTNVLTEKDTILLADLQTRRVMWF
jgi:hypothetical protein